MGSSKDTVSDSRNGLLITDQFPVYVCGVYACSMCEHGAVERNMHRPEEDTSVPSVSPTFERGSLAGSVSLTGIHKSQAIYLSRPPTALLLTVCV